MFITKKQIMSLFFILSLGILQINTLAGVTPAQAADGDSMSLSGQGLLTQVGSKTYGAGQKDVKIVAVNIINVALGFLSILLVALFIFAGFKWMTSGGNEAKIKEATGQMLAAAIGLLIILAAWGITRFVLVKIICVTSTSGICS